MSEEYFPWNEKYETGIPLIDDDHRALFGVVNDLHARISDGGDSSGIKDITDRLIAYTQVHFEREEHLMEEYHYPKLSDHRKLHHDFVRMIYGIRKVQEDRPEKLDPEKLLAFLEGWLRRHVLKADRDYISSVTGTYGQRRTDMSLPIAKVSGLSDEEAAGEEVPVTVWISYKDVGTLRRCANLLRRGGKPAAEIEEMTDPVANLDIEDAMNIARIVLR